MATDILSIVIGTLEATGEELKSIDENKTGADDFAGAILSYAGEVIESVRDNGDLPPFPDELRAGTADKLSDNAKIALRIAIAPLRFVGPFLPKTARAAIKYAVQALSNLLSGQPVPSAPVI